EEHKWAFASQPGHCHIEPLAVCQSSQAHTDLSFVGVCLYGASRVPCLHRREPKRRAIGTDEVRNAAMRSGRHWHRALAFELVPDSRPHHFFGVCHSAKVDVTPPVNWMITHDATSG